MLLIHILSCNKMAKMDWIEAAAKKPDFHASPTVAEAFNAGKATFLPDL